MSCNFEKSVATFTWIQVVENYYHNNCEWKTQNFDVFHGKKYLHDSITYIPTSDEAALLIKNINEIANFQVNNVCCANDITKKTGWEGQYR